MSEERVQISMSNTKTDMLEAESIESRPLGSRCTTIYKWLEREALR